MTSLISLGPVAIDFEVFYDKEISIGTLGVDGYLRHPKAEIYLVSIVGDEGEEFVGHPEDFDWNSLIDRDLWSHNAAFDRRAYHYFRIWYVKKYGIWLPDLETPRWNCTANLSVYHRGGRSLKKAVKNLLGGLVSKDVRKAMLGVQASQMHSMSPSSPSFDDFYHEVCAYALDDSRWCRQLAVEYGPSWPEMERRLSDLTTEGCHRGLPLDIDALEKGQKTLETKIWEVEKKLPWVKEGHPATSPKALAEHCRRAGIPHPPSTSEDDPRCIAWEKQYGKKYPWVGDMRERRKANILLKRAIVLLERECDGVFRYELKYGGAHTLRWSGGREREKAGDEGKGFNVQNPPKEPAFGFNLRHCIRAPQGKKFIIADLSQIEARITPYLAGDEALIKLITGGMNVYEAHARMTMGYTDPRPLKTTNPDLYALAKARVLALGFGCGWQRFRDQAQLEYGVGLDWEAAVWKTQVKDYRASNAKVPRLWNKLENDFRESLGGDYEIEIPSNRVMTYFDVSTGIRTRKIEAPTDREPTEYKKQSFKARVEINGPFKWMYGGLLCENLVQATARDVFGLALLRVKDALPELEFIFSCHDEATWMVDENDDMAVHDVQQILCVTPSWLAGCPIGAEVIESEVYSK